MVIVIVCHENFIELFIESGLLRDESIFANVKIKSYLFVLRITVMIYLGLDSKSEFCQKPRFWIDFEQILMANCYKKTISPTLHALSRCYEIQPR